MGRIAGVSCCGAGDILSCCTPSLGVLGRNVGAYIRTSAFDSSSFQVASF
jgi:hypothetical protein